jgi:hypothetical protein
MPVEYKHLQFQVLDAEQVHGSPDQEDAAALIAERVILGNFDFMAMKIHDYGDRKKLKGLHPDIKMILELIKLTNCPVMSLTTKPLNSVFKNILQPVKLNINIIEWHAQILDFAKAFHSNIHLLLVCNSIDHETFQKGREIIQLSKEYFLSYNLKVYSRIIHHLNISDTILAYASIIGADLIGNVTRENYVMEQGQTDLTWNDLLYRSEIPLYNYIS